MPGVGIGRFARKPLPKTGAAAPSEKAHPVSTGTQPSTFGDEMESSSSPWGSSGFGLGFGHVSDDADDVVGNDSSGDFGEMKPSDTSRGNGRGIFFQKNARPTDLTPQPPQPAANSAAGFLSRMSDKDVVKESTSDITHAFLGNAFCPKPFPKTPPSAVESVQSDKSRGSSKTFPFQASTVTPIHELLPTPTDVADFPVPAPPSTVGPKDVLFSLPRPNKDLQQETPSQEAHFEALARSTATPQANQHETPQEESKIGRVSLESSVDTLTDRESLEKRKNETTEDPTPRAVGEPDSPMELLTDGESASFIAGDARMPDSVKAAASICETDFDASLESSSFEEMHQAIMNNQLQFDDMSKKFDETILDLLVLLSMKHGEILSLEQSALALKEDLSEKLDLLTKKVNM